MIVQEYSISGLYYRYKHVSDERLVGFLQGKIITQEVEGKFYPVSEISKYLILEKLRRTSLTFDAAINFDDHPSYEDFVQITCKTKEEDFDRIFVESKEAFLKYLEIKNTNWVVIPTKLNQEEKTSGRRLNFTYIHGELQEKNGYDIYHLDNCEELACKSENEYCIDPLSVEEGVYRCTSNGDKCLLFYWFTNDTPGQKGLIVLESNLEDIIDASNKYLVNESMI